MQFQVTEIEFDFTTDDGEYELQPSRQEKIIDETIGQIWEADDEDDLLAWSDEFKIVEDSLNFVHIIDGEQTVRVTMPRKTLDDIVKQIHSRVDYHF